MKRFVLFILAVSILMLTACGNNDTRKEKSQEKDSEESINIAALDGDALASPLMSTGNGVLYWRYHPGSFEEVTVPFFNDYQPVAGEINQLVYRRGGTETVICEDSGYGNVCITADRIFYERIQNELDERSNTPVICSVDFSGNDCKTYCRGTLCATDGSYVLFIRTDAQRYHTLSSLCATDGTIADIAEGAYFKAMHRGQAFYVTYPDKTIVLNAVSPDGKKGKELYAHDLSLYAEAASPSFEQLVFAEADGVDYAYFSYGLRAGSAFIYQGGFVARASTDGTFGEILAGPVHATTAEEYCNSGMGPFFYVKPDGNVHPKGQELERAVCDGQRVYTACDQDCRDEVGVWAYAFTVVDAYGEVTGDFTAADIARLLPDLSEKFGNLQDGYLFFRDTVQIGNNLYFRADLCEYDLEDSIGWRDAYRRVYGALVHKDLTSGAITVLNRY